MRLLSWLIVLCTGLLLAAPAGAAPATRIIKVLPHYLDKEGRHSLSPSLYERDAYQAQLRKSPKDRTALRFDIQWKAAKADGDQFTLKVDIRGAKSSGLHVKTLEVPVKRHKLFSNWSEVLLAGKDYEEMGEVAAWRATLWNGDKMVSEQKSFLW